MQKITFLVVAALMIMSCGNNAKTVHLKGEIKNGEKAIFLKVQKPEDALLKNEIKINLDGKSSFDTIINLEQPGYYNLGYQTTLYFSPGDDITMVYDFKKPQNSSFTGKGAAANNYLKDKYNARGGTFIDYDYLNSKPTKEAVKNYVPQKVTERKNELSQLKNVTPKFRKMEEARIHLDAANSYLMYATLGAYYCGLSREEQPKFTKETLAFFNDEIEKNCLPAGDKEFLAITKDYQSIYNQYLKTTANKVDAEVTDYFKVANFMQQLGIAGPSKKMLAEKDTLEKTVKNPMYIEVLNAKIATFDNILPGKPAPMLTFNNISGKEFSLSDFKGKVIVLDFWATWCGPCKHEAPFFEKLAEEFKDNSDIVFLSISLDKDVDAWKKYLQKKNHTENQFRTTGDVVKPYQIIGIPRFMIMGKRGEIVDAFAPRPSQPEMKEVLEASVK